MKIKQKNNFTGFIQYIVAYPIVSKDKILLPSAYGINEYYFVYNGVISFTTLVDAITEKPLDSGFYNVKATSDNILAIINRTIQ